MKFLDIFEPIQKGDFGLTDEIIYKSIERGGDFIPLWGGNKEHRKTDKYVSVNGKTKSGNDITIFDGDGIVISLDGSSGCMTYKNGEKFSLNHHAGFFRLKKGKNGVFPEFFAIFFENQLRQASLSEGSKTLTLDMIYSTDFDIPSLSVQKKILTIIKPLLEKKSKIDSVVERLETAKNKILSETYKKHQAKNVPIKEIFDLMSGNSGLTEEEIYKKILVEGERYKVLSSSTQESNMLGQIPMCVINGKKIKVFEDKEGILVVRKGKAGTLCFLSPNKYTVNDDAYILSIKEDTKFDISLKWFMYQYKDKFLEFSSSSDNGTWNKTTFFQNVLIDIPSKSEQLKVLRCYEKIETLEDRLKDTCNKIDKLLSKSLSSESEVNN